MSVRCPAPTCQPPPHRHWVAVAGALRALPPPGWTSPMPPQWSPDPYRSPRPWLPRNLDTNIPVKFKAPSNSLFPQSALATLPLVQSRSHQTLRAHHTLQFFLTSSKTLPTQPLPALFFQSKARTNRRAHLGSFGHPHHGHYRRSEPQSFFQTAIQQREIFELQI